jgi:iron complex outermembrane recepter protein
MRGHWYIVTSLLSIAIAMLIAEPSLAQTTMPPVVVTAPLGGSAGGSLDLGRAASVGSRLGLTLREQPAAVEIIPGEALRARGDLTAQEAVTRATGITAAGTPGDGSSALASRGFVGHDSVTQLYDGTRLYVGAGTMTFPVDTWLLDRVEVLRGPASVIDGVGAIGGAINYVPRQPLRNVRLTDALFTAGSYNTYQLGANTTGPIMDRAAYQIGIIGTKSNGYVDMGDSRRLSVASSLLFDALPNLTLRLAFDGTWNEPTRYWGTPLNEGNIDDRLRKRNYNVSDSDISWDDYWVRLGTDWRIAPTVTLRNELYFLKTDRHWLNVENYAFLPATSQVDRTSYIEIFHDEHQIGNRLDVRLDGNVLQRPYRLLAGFDVNQIYFKRTSNTPFDGQTFVDAFRPIPGLFRDDPNVPDTRPEFESRTTQFSFFTEGLLRVTDRFKLVAGLRVDYIDYSRDDLIDATRSFDKTYSPVTWRVGSVFDVTKAVSLYGQITRGVDPLSSLITLPARQRDTELTTAYQYEIGLKTQLFDGRAEATLATYYLVKHNLQTPNPDRPSEIIQVGQQSAYGVEFAVGLRPVPQIAIDANIALLNAQFDDLKEFDANDELVSRNGKQPVDVPEFVANLYAVYAPTPQWSLGTGVRHVGERFADNANTVREPPYTLVDVFVTYKPTRWLDLTLRGRNLTNADYAIASYGSTQFILGQPRSAEFVANVRF